MCNGKFLAIDQRPANDEMDPSLFSYGLGWATMEVVSTIGIDSAKSVFHLCGMDDQDTVVLRRRLSRGKGSLKKSV